MATTRKKVNWNGFTVCNCKTMEGTDGYVLSCDLKLNGKKVAHCFDGGYGGEMEISTEKGISYKKLSEAVKGFKEDRVDPEDGFVHEFDLESMIYQMMDAEELSKDITKARAKGYFVAVIERKHYLPTVSYNVPFQWSDELAKTKLLQMKGAEEFRDMTFYRNVEQLDINNKEVRFEDIAC